MTPREADDGAAQGVIVEGVGAICARDLGNQEGHGVKHQAAVCGGIGLAGTECLFCALSFD